MAKLYHRTSSNTLKVKNPPTLLNIGYTLCSLCGTVLKSKFWMFKTARKKVSIRFLSEIECKP